MSSVLDGDVLHVEPAQVLGTEGVQRLLDFLHANTDDHGDIDTLQVLTFLEHEGAVTFKEIAP